MGSKTLKINTNRCVDVETWEEARFLARLDFELVRGSEITVDRYLVIEDDDSHELFDEVRFKVGTTHNRWEEELQRRYYEYLDPAWDLEAVNPADVGAALYPWTEGPSYRVLEAVAEESRVPCDGGLRT